MSFLEEYVKEVICILTSIVSFFYSLTPSFLKRRKGGGVKRRRKVFKGEGSQDLLDEDEEAANPLLFRDASLDGDSNLLRMHRPSLQDRFGSLRFRTEYSTGRQHLLVTVIDAWDLPPMDSDGKADPYVEVSIRPGGGSKKFSTTVRPNCLNPTFNETAEIGLRLHEIEGKDLVLKVMDSDTPLQDELIGMVRIPLHHLKLESNPSPRLFTCLILHEKEKNGKISLSPGDGAKLNLKVSQQAQKIYDLEVKLKLTEERLEKVGKEYSELRSQHIELEMDHLNREIDTPLSNDSLEKIETSRKTSLDIPDGHATSAPVSKGGSPVVARNGRDKIKMEKSYQLLQHLQSTLKQKDQELKSLREFVADMKPRLELMSSRNGQIDLGLSFYHVTSRLRIDVMSARNLRAVNLTGDHSDPFVKVRVFRQIPGELTERWKFETRTVWKSIHPIWNEHFIIDDEITVDDLPNMLLEVTVYDREIWRGHQPLGKVRIGPNQTADSQHWEEMIKQHGTIVKMTHALKDV